MSVAGGDRRWNWNPPIRYGITDRRLAPDLGVEAYWAALSRTSAHFLQLREKDLPAAELRRWTAVAVEACRQTGRWLIVNSAWEEALRAGAAGVHLPATVNLAETVPRIRSAAPTGFLIGYSAHSLEEARAAEDSGVDYVLVAPVQTPLTKRDSRPPLGWSGLAEITAGVTIPVFALGGVTPADEARALEAGAVGIAGISWVHAEMRKQLGRPESSPERRD